MAAASSAAGSSGEGFASRPAFVIAQSDRGLTPLDQSLAGAGAKAVTKFVLYPLDTWKARCQVRRMGIEGQFRGMWTFAGMYRGLVPKIVLYTPYQAVYMAAYVELRDRYMVPLASVPGGRAVAYMAAGASAEITASLVRLPMEVAKLRLQLGVYNSTWHAARQFLTRPRDFYGNFVQQTLAHDCVFSACSWLCYETGRQWLFAQHGEATLPAAENLALGTLAGAFTALATTPLDVLKTRVVGRAPGSGPGSLRAALRELLRDEGPLALWRGAALRVAHLAPSQGLYMLLYELAKRQLASQRRAGD